MMAAATAGGAAGSTETSRAVTKRMLGGLRLEGVQEAAAVLAGMDLGDSVAADGVAAELYRAAVAPGGHAQADTVSALLAALITLDKSSGSSGNGRVLRRLLLTRLETAFDLAPPPGMPWPAKSLAAKLGAVKFVGALLCAGAIPPSIILSCLEELLKGSGRTGGAAGSHNLECAVLLLGSTARQLDATSADSRCQVDAYFKAAHKALDAGAAQGNPELAASLHRLSALRAAGWELEQPVLPQPSAPVPPAASAQAASAHSAPAPSAAAASRSAGVDAAAAALSQQLSLGSKADGPPSAPTPANSPSEPWGSLPHASSQPQALQQPPSHWEEHLPGQYHPSQQQQQYHIQSPHLLAPQPLPPPQQAPQHFTSVRATPPQAPGKLQAGMVPPPPSQPASQLLDSFRPPQLHDSFSYLSPDGSGQLFGPFSLEQMLFWAQQGHLSLDVKVKRSNAPEPSVLLDLGVVRHCFHAALPLPTAPPPPLAAQPPTHHTAQPPASRNGADRDGPAAPGMLAPAPGMLAPAPQPPPHPQHDPAAPHPAAAALAPSPPPGFGAQQLQQQSQAGAWAAAAGASGTGQSALAAASQPWPELGKARGAPMPLPVTVPPERAAAASPVPPMLALAPAPAHSAAFQPQEVPDAASWDSTPVWPKPAARPAGSAPLPVPLAARKAPFQQSSGGSVGSGGGGAGGNGSASSAGWRGGANGSSNGGGRGVGGRKKKSGVGYEDDKEWLLKSGRGKVSGPFTGHELLDMLHNDTLAEDTQVKKNDWKSYKAMEEVEGAILEMFSSRPAASATKPKARPAPKPSPKPAQQQQQLGRSSSDLENARSGGSAAGGGGGGGGGKVVAPPGRSASWQQRSVVAIVARQAQEFSSRSPPYPSPSLAAAASTVQQSSEPALVSPPPPAGTPAGGRGGAPGTPDTAWATPAPPPPVAGPPTAPVTAGGADGTPSFGQDKAAARTPATQVAGRYCSTPNQPTSVSGLLEFTPGFTPADARGPHPAEPSHSPSPGSTGSSTASRFDWLAGPGRAGGDATVGQVAAAPKLAFASWSAAAAAASSGSR